MSFLSFLGDCSLWASDAISRGHLAHKRPTHRRCARRRRPYGRAPICMQTLPSWAPLAVGDDSCKRPGRIQRPCKSPGHEQPPLHTTCSQVAATLLAAFVANRNKNA
ncbi:hypothetical protein BHE74_00042730 [Ensete ventricosum]|nr:hypothetical protein GW17_00009902 [Ensete ventricosum]RWW51015.1 hypothetical protein BHE74_00042730 [Ensete ventricosum]RZS10112.1 hypothetical protein BHM03_00041279 [Ensete ventricosum]